MYGNRMKLLVHDFCGHPFTLELAVELADRGHDVDYVYFGSETNPKGDFEDARNRPRPPRIHALWISQEPDPSQAAQQAISEHQYRIEMAVR